MIIQDKGTIFAQVGEDREPIAEVGLNTETGLYTFRLLPAPSWGEFQPHLLPWRETPTTLVEDVRAALRAGHSPWEMTPAAEVESVCSRLAYTSLSPEQIEEDNALNA